jgi:hypothetical protein
MEYYTFAAKQIVPSRCMFKPLRGNEDLFGGFALVVVELSVDQVVNFFSIEPF